jgi:hypothetical protein
MIREGSVVRIRVRLGLKVGRVGVVLRFFIVDGRRLVLVAWGTGTLRTHLRSELVRPREPAGRALGLTKPTYFYGHNYWVGVETEVDVQPGTCPGSLLAELRALVGGQTRSG